ncbi:MAG TPA: nitrate reductase associated protein, partial [Fibrobacteres bacterium]|nr:nitrate reductase associated protein [Fibrobacterota bacterium]
MALLPPNLFAFERDEFGDLNWMPLALRYRLDLCGLKLPLSTWQR